MTDRTLDVLVKVCIVSDQHCGVQNGLNILHIIRFIITITAHNFLETKKRYS